MVIAYPSGEKIRSFYVQEIAMDDEFKLKTALAEAAISGQDPAGKGYRYLSLAATVKLAEEYKISHRKIELAALDLEIIPERYQRSIGTIGLKGQARLLRATVAVIGAGGLGGFVLELLARMGIGKLVVADGDVFADSNLNRQMISTEADIGKSKVKAVAERIAKVNSATSVEACHLVADESNLPALLKECNLVIDCLDNLPSRFDLEKACSQMDLVLIHGAIAGLLGQIAVIRPGKPLLESIYGSVAQSGITRGVEVQLGNPAATPAMLAAWQVSEAVKYLAGVEGVLPDNNLLIIDMQTAESYKVEITT
jgi:molybdopterin-synthase adenylyltransferase